MTLGLLFWLLMIIWLVFMICVYAGMVATTYAAGGTVFLFVVLAVLGWGVFGPPLRR